MSFLILGLLIFLGSHSLRMLAPDWRAARIARLGEKGWKGAFYAVALLGFGLIVWGYGLARHESLALWTPPTWMRHLAASLTLPAFILLVAAYLPGNRIKAKIGHPMVAGVKLWALAHLLSNGNLADVVLFGSFMVWAVLNFAASRRRDRLAGTTYPALGVSRDALAVAVGIVAWALFAFYGHAWLIGVSPFRVG